MGDEEEDSTAEHLKPFSLDHVPSEEFSSESLPKNLNLAKMLPPKRSPSKDGMKSPDSNHKSSSFGMRSPESNHKSSSFGIIEPPTNDEEIEIPTHSSFFKSKHHQDSSSISLEEEIDPIHQVQTEFPQNSFVSPQITPNLSNSSFSFHEDEIIINQKVNNQNQEVFSQKFSANFPIKEDSDIKNLDLLDQELSQIERNKISRKNPSVFEKIIPVLSYHV